MGAGGPGDVVAPLEPAVLLVTLVEAAGIDDELVVGASSRTVIPSACATEATRHGTRWMDPCASSVRRA